MYLSYSKEIEREAKQGLTDMTGFDVGACFTTQNKQGSTFIVVLRRIAANQSLDVFLARRYGVHTID
jgi:hypothetical protein